MVNMNILIIRTDKLIICFSGTTRVNFNLRIKTFYSISSIHIEKSSVHINCQFSVKLAVICHHFVCFWLVVDNQPVEDCTY